VDKFLPVRFYWVRRTRSLKLEKDHEALARGIGPAGADVQEPAPALT